MLRHEASIIETDVR